MLPLALGRRLHLLVFLVHQEVLDGQSAGLPHGALGAASHGVRRVGAAERAAAALVAHGRAGLLRALLTSPRLNESGC